MMNYPKSIVYYSLTFLYCIPLLGLSTVKASSNDGEVYFTSILDDHQIGHITPTLEKMDDLLMNNDQFDLNTKKDHYPPLIAILDHGILIDDAIPIMKKLNEISKNKKIPTQKLNPNQEDSEQSRPIKMLKYRDEKFKIPYIGMLYQIAEDSNIPIELDSEEVQREIIKLIKNHFPKNEQHTILARIKKYSKIKQAKKRNISNEVKNEEMDQKVVEITENPVLPTYQAGKEGKRQEKVYFPSILLNYGESAPREFGSISGLLEKIEKLATNDDSFDLNGVQDNADPPLCLLIEYYLPMEHTLLIMQKLNEISKKRKIGQKISPNEKNGEDAKPIEMIMSYEYNDKDRALYIEMLYQIAEDSNIPIELDSEEVQREIIKLIKNHFPGDEQHTILARIKKYSKIKQAKKRNTSNEVKNEEIAKEDEELKINLSVFTEPKSETIDEKDEELKINQRIPKSNNENYSLKKGNIFTKIKNKKEGITIFIVIVLITCSLGRAIWDRSHKEVE